LRSNAKAARGRQRATPSHSVSIATWTWSISPARRQASLRAGGWKRETRCRASCSMRATMISWSSVATRDLTVYRRLASRRFCHNRGAHCSLHRPPSPNL
jgi:hypothetical protein